MFDVLHFEGPLAHYTLRRWTAGASGTRSQAERIRPTDEHEVLTLLRHAVDSAALRRLTAFMYEDMTAMSPSDDPLELLWLVARRVVSGELLLERELIVPMASDTVERPVVELPPPIVNEFDELSRPRPKPEPPELRLATQAKEAAKMGKPFCEACTGPHSQHGPGPIEPDPLATQAQQAAALRTASKQGSAFCEVCAHCTPAPRLPSAPPSGLGAQANQANALAAASKGGKGFCEQCRC